MQAAVQSTVIDDVIITICMFEYIFIGAYGWRYPMDIIVDNTNSNIYVSDRHIISKIDVSSPSSSLSANYITTDVCGTSLYGYRDGSCATAQFFEPRFIVIDNGGKYLYVSDIFNFNIRRISLQGDAVVMTYANFTGETNGIVLNSANTYMYAAATSLNGLWKIPIVDQSITSSSYIFMTNPSKAVGQLVDGPLASSLWSQPGTLAIDSGDMLYVIDTWETTTIKTVKESGKNMYQLYFNYAIRRVSTLTSTVSTMAGKYCVYSVSSRNAATSNTAPSTVCYSNGNSTQTGLSRSKSNFINSYIAVGSGGNKLYFTDYINSVIRKIDCETSSGNTEMSYGLCVCKGQSGLIATNPTTSLDPSAIPSLQLT